jgi:hypothetical protein
MKRITYVAAAVTLAVSCQALALGNLADVTIIDRDNGTTLSAHYYRGEYWVAGNPGARYAIEVRNCAGERLMAVTSVDGVNVISGATAAWDQSGYVFDPGEQYQITGWRKSHAEVADFTFTAAPDSYAGRTGRPANIGVIGVAIFRERPSMPEIARSQPQPAPPPAPDAGTQRAPTLWSRLSQMTGARSAAAAATAAPTMAAPPAEPRLGTGHGERESSYVIDTEFLRLQAEPNEIIRIHYDSLRNLVALGIVKPPRPVRPLPDPFPGSHEPSFVPDPPG